MSRISIDDPDLPLSVLFERWPKAAEPFLARRMLCFGCPIAPFHTVVDSCQEYSLDEEDFRERLREAAGVVG